MKPYKTLRIAASCPNAQGIPTELQRRIDARSEGKSYRPSLESEFRP